MSQFQQTFAPTITDPQRMIILENWDINQAKAIAGCGCENLNVEFSNFSFKDPLDHIWEFSFEFKCCGKKGTLTNRK